MRENWQTVKYAIPFNAFCLFWIIILCGKLNFWPTLPISLLVLLVIDFLYWRAQKPGRPTKPSFSLYTGAAIFLMGALSVPFSMIREQISFLALLGSIPAAFVGIYSLRAALRIQERQASERIENHQKISEN